MNSLLLSLMGALLATNQPAVVSNIIYQRTGEEVEITASNDPVEKEFREVMIKDDDAQTEVDKWIRDNQRFVKAGAGQADAELNQRILKRFEPVRKAYEDFIKRHPNHARARTAFASFLDDIQDEEASREQLEKALELNPKNPAIWNNLANYYGHTGDLKKAFDYYAKAIELNPNESVYYHNLGTTVFLFRKDAMEHYAINEQQVFDKALEIYRKAMQADPDNFPLASDVAQTYYGIRPWRFNDALGAWTNALKIAHTEIERQGVYLHMARIEIQAGRWTQATNHLNAVTNAQYNELKDRVTRSLGFWKTNTAPRPTNISSIKITPPKSP